MKRNKKILLIILLLILSVVGISFFVYKYKTRSYKNLQNNIEKINIDGYDNLMIVAHPDDEMLWGGSHLIDETYLVVCITCGKRRDRAEEFINVMNETKDQYLMLNYPDKTNGKRDNWDKYYKEIEKDLRKIISYKNWNLIVTHNPDGEYGHNHHIMTSKITTDMVNLENKNNKLMYFGKYYKKENVPKMDKISEENYKKKMDVILPLYVSQKSTTELFSHMMYHENWVTLKEWNEVYAK